MSTTVHFKIPSIRIDLNFINEDGSPELMALLPDQIAVPDVGERVIYEASGQNWRIVSGVVKSRTFWYKEGADFSGAVVSVYATVIESQRERMAGPEACPGVRRIGN